MREFGIKNGLTVEQFFSSGFLEAKVDLTIQCVEIVKGYLPKKKPGYRSNLTSEKQTNSGSLEGKPSSQDGSFIEGDKDSKYTSKYSDY